MFARRGLAPSHSVTCCYELSIKGLKYGAVLIRLSAQGSWAKKAVSVLEVSAAKLATSPLALLPSVLDLLCSVLCAGSFRQTLKQYAFVTSFFSLFSCDRRVATSSAADRSCKKDGSLYEAYMDFVQGFGFRTALGLEHRGCVEHLSPFSRKVIHKGPIAVLLPLQKIFKRCPDRLVLNTVQNP